MFGELKADDFKAHSLSREKRPAAKQQEHARHDAPAHHHNLLARLAVPAPRPLRALRSEVQADLDLRRRAVLVLVHPWWEVWNGGA